MDPRRTRPLCAVALATLASLLATTSPAHAEAPTASEGGDISRTAGYSVLMREGARPRLSATIVVPILSCSDIEEALETTVKVSADDGLAEASIQSECDSGIGRHGAVFYSSDGGLGSIEGEIEDGDVINVAIESLGNEGLTKITVSNQTQGWTVIGKFTVPDVDAAAVGQYPWPDAEGGRPILHTRTTFKHVKVGRADLADTDYRRTNLHDYDGTLLMRATPIRHRTNFVSKYVG